MDKIGPILYKDQPHFFHHLTSFDAILQVHRWLSRRWSFRLCSPIQAFREGGWGVGWSYEADLLASLCPARSTHSFTVINMSAPGSSIFILWRTRSFNFRTKDEVIPRTKGLLIFQPPFFRHLGCSLPESKVLGCEYNVSLSIKFTPTLFT